MITHLGRYEIIEELGRGAMGIVYKANDPLIERLVAIKAINLKNLTASEKEEYEARFYQEAKAAGRLNHPNIVTIHDLGESGGVAYIAMELLEGCELQNFIEDNPQLSLDDMLDISIQVATGLAYAHQHGIVHRDIKPSNIMVLKNNHVKIADFGIARMSSSLIRTQTDVIMGSPYYMSPEQILGRPIDSRSDIFSMGIVLYKMLTGRLPFFSNNANSVMYQIANEIPEKPSALNSKVTYSLDNIISNCLAKNPDDRYQNAHEMAEDLLKCRSGFPDTKLVVNSSRRYFGSDAFIYNSSIANWIHINKVSNWKLICILMLTGFMFISTYQMIVQFYFSK